MKTLIFITAIIAFAINSSFAQNMSANSGIDIMLINGNYGRVIDTCNQILAYDSLNPDIYYKLGIAYQNILDDNKSLNSFYHAARLNPDNKVFSFMLAKGYYGKEKFTLAEPLLRKLLSSDSTNWPYAYYLTSIYMQNYKYDDAINVYKSFLMQDSSNCTYLDKLGFASLKKGDFEYAADLYKRSLLINNRNLIAIKNLAYLYSLKMESDTALQLLTRGIDIDSSDMDLYIRRAAINYSKNYTKRAMDDYMRVLSSGDSSRLYLKRAGIGYCNNLQPGEGINYLLLAYKKDSSDYETCSYLGQSYYKLQNLSKSIYYYNRVIKILTPVNTQLGLTYILYAESQKENGRYEEAIDSYLNGQGINSSPNIYMIVANIYDEKLNDREKAIYFYQKFLSELNNSKMTFTPEYVDTIKKRLDFLKKKPVISKKSEEKL